MVSGENQPDLVISMSLPEELEINEEKALGIYWNIQADSLYVKADLAKLGKKFKRGTTAVEVLVSPNHDVSIAPHLTLRACLSLHAKPFDALGFVLPTRIIGNLLFRTTLQTMKKESKGKRCSSK